MSKIQHTVFFKLPDLIAESDKFNEMQATIQKFNAISGIVASFRAAGSPGKSLADTLSEVDWQDKTNGYTHCLLVIADDIAALKAYLHSATHKEEWVGHVKPIAAGPPIVFDSPLGVRVEAPEGKTQHTVLFKLPTPLPEELSTHFFATLGKFNEMPGIAASFAEAGSPGLSLADTLAAVEWPDKTDGYTHCLLVIADDLPSLKTYLHSAVHKEEWGAKVRTVAAGPPIVFDSPLALSLL